MGASAACLAATSFDSHSHSTQFSSAMSQENWKGALDPDKAEELDTLIQAGDWEGKSTNYCTLNNNSKHDSSHLLLHSIPVVMFDC